MDHSTHPQLRQLSPSPAFSEVAGIVRERGCALTCTYLQKKMYANVHRRIQKCVYAWKSQRKAVHIFPLRNLNNSLTAQWGRLRARLLAQTHRRYSGSEFLHRNRFLCAYHDGKVKSSYLPNLSLRYADILAVFMILVVAIWWLKLILGTLPE